MCRPPMDGGGGRGERLGRLFAAAAACCLPVGDVEKGNIRLRQGSRVGSRAVLSGFSVPGGPPRMLRLRRQVQPRCGGCAGRFGGYTVVAKQEPRHGGGVVSRARGRIGFSEAAAAAVRFGWLGLVGGGSWWAGGSNFSQTKRHRGAKCPIMVLIATMGSACILWVRGYRVPFTKVLL